MKKIIDETLVKMSSSDFLKNIKKVFDEVFSEGNIEKINLMNYLSEENWLKIKKAGLLLPFLSEKFGGRKTDQKEIQEVLRIAGNYGVPVTLRTGIEGALVLQPLVEFGNEEQIETGLESIFNSEGGGLAITEPNTSGSSIAKEMESYFEYVDENNIYVKAEKYWQGNSQSDFLLVAAKEKKNEKLSKEISLIYVPRENITYDVLKSEGLRAVRYAVNRVDGVISAKNLMKLSDSKINALREFQNIFIRSRLQLIGMTHGIMECVTNNIGKYTREGIKFVETEVREIKRKYGISKIMYDYVCNNISPEKSVSDKLMEANIIKSLATEYTYKAAQIAQKLLGAKGFESGHVLSNLAIDFRPFTIFEGPNDMLYADIFDQFSRATAEEKENGIKVKKDMTLYERFTSDTRFKNIMNNDIIEKTKDLVEFMKENTLDTIDQIKKVFVGKILSRVFLLIQSNDEEVSNHIINDIRKDMLDFKYY